MWFRQWILCLSFCENIKISPAFFRSFMKVFFLVLPLWRFFLVWPQVNANKSCSQTAIHKSASRWLKCLKILLCFWHRQVWPLQRRVYVTGSPSSSWKTTWGLALFPTLPCPVLCDIAPFSTGRRMNIVFRRSVRCPWYARMAWPSWSAPIRRHVQTESRFWSMENSGWCKLSQERRCHACHWPCSAWHAQKRKA